MNALKRKQAPHKLEYRKKSTKSRKSSAVKIKNKENSTIKSDSPEASQTVSEETFEDFISRWYQSKEITEQQKEKFILIKNLIDLYVEKQGLNRRLFYDETLINNAFNFFNLVNNNN